MKSHKPFLLTSVVWGVLLVSSTPLWSQTEVRPGFNIFSVEQDVEIGGQSAAEVEKQLPLLNDSTVQGYITKIGERLAAVVQGPDFPYQFKVVNVSDINAFALPGGYMFVNRGLIEAATSEGELAGVMAHEIAHVALRHGTNQASKAYLAQTGLGVLGGLFGGGTTSDIVGAVGGFGLNATFMKFSRTAEEQSDVVGAQMLARARYDPMAMASFFETLREEAGKDPGKLEQFFSSHPAPANRARRIREEVRLLGSVRPGRPVGDFSRLKSRLLGHPKAPSMADLAEGSASEGGSQDPEGREGPRSINDIALPSDQLVLYESASRSFRMRYPSNWKPLDPNQAAGATLAPDGGIFEASGQSHIVYGIVVDVFEGSGSRRTRNGPYPARDELERDSNQLIQSLLGSNNYLRYLRGSDQEELVDGERALSIVLTGRSPVTGELERVRVLSRELPNDRLLFVLFIAPERRYGELEQIMNRIVSSLSINDPSLPGR
ncbi:MAG: M48 family metallopeptidase [Spirochaetia bacterium]